MNELQRQMYLSALGIETYMPRWHLPFSPISMACKSVAIASAHHNEQNTIFVTPTVKNIALENLSPLQALHSQTFDSQPLTNSITPINNLMSELFATKKIVNADIVKSSAADMKAQVNSAASITAFSLSIWRPMDEVMIIDSRNTQLALPTELFLQNILRNQFQKKKLDLKNEVVRWPMVENSLTKHTVDDARTGLQTWLSVQHEVRPVKFLWLMGANSATYFLPPDAVRNNCLWQAAALVDCSVAALILPSLNELLQQPLQKKQLYSALKNYHS
jgi:hypothetical protein